jgi:phytoene dehydrogenase-like protein
VSGTETRDVVVIGGGFGGLSTALCLAEAGVRVTLLESLRYPGGCASTFTRGGHRFEAGATLLSGFEAGQLFGRWIERFDLDVEIDWIDPIVEFRAPGLRLAIPRGRGTLVDRLAELPGAPPRARLAAFFTEQRKIADLLWAMLDEPELLPPLDLRALVRHAMRAPRYVRLLRYLGRPLAVVLRDFGLDRFAPLRLLLDGLCQITVQCGLDEAEAPVALGATDYYFRGTGHVRGGVGVLAWSLARAIERLGGDVRFASRARSLKRSERGWRVETRSGSIEAPVVVANLIPQSLSKLVGDPTALGDRVTSLAREVETGWGACMLYGVCRARAGADEAPRHFELVLDPALPLIEGNHLFCSVSGASEVERAPRGLRTLTVSTHVPMPRLRGMKTSDRAAYVEQIQSRMRAGLAELLPEWGDVEESFTASPRTFERFTGRFQGYVGGIPRRAGLSNYRRLWPRAVGPGLYLVGDTVFPGQSTLATAIGGSRLAEHLLRGPLRGLDRAQPPRPIRLQGTA